jgi:outer membrane protein assembly factor BamC
LIKLGLLLLASVGLSSCGFIYGDDGLIKSQKYDYVTAKQSKPLEIPSKLEHKGKVDFTVVPQIGVKAKTQAVGKELVQAAPIQLLAVLDNTRVDKKSAVPSVLIIDSNEFIWSMVNEFLNEHNIPPSEGESADKLFVSEWIAIDKGGIWLGVDGSDEPDLLRAKYRIALSNGEIKGEQRLTVERINSQKREDDDLEWQEGTISWQESADMMNLLLSFYDGRIRVRQAKRQREIMAGFKVELGKDSDGGASLLTSASETLVWDKIPKVMYELGFQVIDKDIRQKTYFLEYKEQEQGFFASLFDESQQQNLFEEGAYQISVGETGDRRSLTIKNGQGDAIDAKLLVKLYPELNRLFGDRR